MPDIEYPCKWVFKIFGKDTEALRQAVAGIMPCSSYSLTPSHSSRNNRYHCMNLELEVVSDEDRLDIYRALVARPEILIVL